MKISELKLNHPCFAAGKTGNTENGRIHLPVSPGCNIECRYCERSVNNFEEAPGVSGGVISPQEAVEALSRALELCPEITVAGIAGPGDTLATPYAIETFRLIKQKFPKLITCMSTNGLMLPERIEEVAANVDSLTVTLNTLNAATGAKIYNAVYYGGKRYTGIDAAEVLLENQLTGIEKAAAAGVTVKINTVLIPEINGDEIAGIAEKASSLGAGIFNIIPLLPRAHFRNFAAPGCDQISSAREQAEEYIKVFRHCGHCRADAVGKLGGKDFRDAVFLNLPEVENTFSHG
ncbi:radical SAM family protein [Clostridia bacterium]|nr:radical SAM family protein [Clostridia bacterium]